MCAVVDLHSVGLRRIGSNMLVIIRLVLLVLLAATPAIAQESRPGVGIDAKGDHDPTKNVLDLVAALKEMLAELRTADNLRHDDLRAAEIRRVNETSIAETRRVNELNAQKIIFDAELAKILRANVDQQALLLATQLKDARADLSVQVKELKTDLSDRVSKLEHRGWENAGRGAGIESVIAWIFGAIAASVAVGTLLWKRPQTAVMPNGERKIV